MAGRRRRRGHPRRAQPPLPPPPGEPSPLEPATLREVAVVERPSKKTCRALSSTSSATSGPDVWADLLDSLLHQIIAFFRSFHDLLAFVGTCRSWRAALCTLPPPFSFNFPPLHFQPDIGDPRPHRSYVKHNFLSNCKWQLVDPAKTTSSLRCSAPRNLRGRMHYLGCSYGYLIFSNSEQCFLVDVYSGTTMPPLKLKSTGNHGIYYGVLVPALDTSKLHLLLCSRSSIVQWQLETNSWLEHPLDGEGILQIVFFNGEIFAMGFLGRLHRIRLAPQLSVQELAVVWGEDMLAGLNFKPWLVVCGDMLLLVDLSINIADLPSFSYTFRLFCLDFSVEPAKWVKVENLRNHALFVSFDGRNPTFSCMGPERWGGKSNCIYVASQSEDSNEPWDVVELGQAVPRTMWSGPIQTPNDHCDQLQNLWVLPSLAYGIGR